MNELQIFNSEEFGDIRTVTIENEPWFVGKDVATALGYADTFGALKKHIMDEDKLVCQIDSAGQKRDVTVINESGLYALIFGSKLESARRFKHWVTSEVLPAIRKISTYRNLVTGLVSRDFELCGVQYDEYSKQCAMNAMSAIFQLVQNTDKADMKSLNTSNLREVVAQCASLKLNASSMPRG